MQAAVFHRRLQPEEKLLPGVQEERCPGRWRLQREKCHCHPNCTGLPSPDTSTHRANDPAQHSVTGPIPAHPPAHPPAHSHNDLLSLVSFGRQPYIGHASPHRRRDGSLPQNGVIMTEGACFQAVTPAAVSRLAPGRVFRSVIGLAGQEEEADLAARCSTWEPKPTLVVHRDGTLASDLYTAFQAARLFGMVSPDASPPFDVAVLALDGMDVQPAWSGMFAGGFQTVAAMAPGKTVCYETVVFAHSGSASPFVGPPRTGCTVRARRFSGPAFCCRQPRSALGDVALPDSCADASLR